MSAFCHGNEQHVLLAFNIKQGCEAENLTKYITFFNRTVFAIYILNFLILLS